MISIAIAAPLLVVGIALVSWGVSEWIVRPLVVVVAVVLLVRFTQPTGD